MTDVAQPRPWYGAVNALQEKIEELGGAEYFARVIDLPVDEWTHRCHQVSLAFVRTGVFGPQARVARGSCPGVRGQHSWVSVSENCYERYSPIVDPTLWSYRDDVPKIVVATLLRYGHTPHGSGRIFEWGQPVRGAGKVVELRPKEPLSDLAQTFLEMLGPLDYMGWARLTSAPVEDWPAGEIFAAMDDTPELRALVPIDKLGMLTDRNPEGLYR